MPEKRGRGRPPALPDDPDELEKDARFVRLIQGLEAGAPIRLACAYAGLGESTYFEHQAARPDFAERVMRARASSAIRNLALIQRAAPEDWRAAAKAVELSFPSEFSATSKVELTGRDGGPLKVVAAEVTPDFVASVLSRLSEAGGGASEEGSS